MSREVISPKWLMAASSDSTNSSNHEFDEAKRRDQTPPSTSGDFSLQLPEKIGRFAIEMQLGRGGYGCVYKAVDTQLGRVVAIKVPRWDRPLRPNEFERFLNEGRALAKVFHPSIVSVFDVGQTESGLPYVVMEFVDGQSLRDLIRLEPLELRESLELLRQIGEALQVAHSFSLVHRDLKPGNIIVSTTNQIKLVDFGLALHDDLCWSDLSPAVEGTLPYMAPEQIRGENHRIDGQTDIWSFGVIMYRLITGKMPFRAQDRADLARQIGYRQPTPPRQLNAGVPLELQRICLRCLAKRLVDRYPSMADVLDELKAAKREIFDLPPTATQVIAEPTTDSASHPPDASGSNVSNAGSKSGTGGQTGSSLQALNSGLRIVPKGLHSFSEIDKDEFLHLLPGPRDRLGIPESIRFWSSRLSSRATDDGAIGLIYGPSGCGKSSFIKAGLLPRLPASVLPVYLDCAGRDTELRLVRQIGRVVQSISPTNDLVATIRELRTGDHLHSGDKVLLVLDQFEQWLSAHGRYAGQTLTEALRQCDGDTVACLLLVRDDFWMSVCEFLSELEVGIAEGHNAMALPLFDEAHARDVLAAFGRAFHRLPEDHRQLEKQQMQFLKDAGRMLANNGKVICVHLSVFAEMMKDREWTAAELRRMGGLAGVGVRFLEDTFSSSLARPEARRCEPMARKILEQLIPATTATIKGPIRTVDELRGGLGSGARPEEFQRGLRFLADDIKVIAEVESSAEMDAEALSAEPANDNRQRYYQLAHDFLVEPIRQWLHDKKMTNWRGRAELQLQSLGDQWNARKDSRFFPGAVDLAQMLWSVDSRSRDKYREYLGAARRRYSIYLAAALILLGISLGLFGLARRQSARNEAAQLADRFLLSNPADVPSALEDLRPFQRYAAEHVKSQLQSADQRQRLHAHYFAVLESPDGASFIPALLDLVAKDRSEELRNVIAVLQAHPADACRELRRRIENGDDPEIQSRMANFLTELGDASGIAHALQLRPDPTLRTTFMHSFADSPHDLVSLVRQLDGVTDYDVHSGMILALGQFSPDQLRSDERDACLKYFERMFRSPEASGGAHSAAEWVLLHWGHADIVDSLEGPTEPGGPWFILPIEGEILTFVRIPGGLAELGVNAPDGVPASYTAPVETREFDSFYMSNTPISLKLVNVFRAAEGTESPETGNVPPESALGDRLGSAEMPDNSTDWNLSVQFCNWLSARADLRAAYARTSDSWLPTDGPGKGFRLPTSAEWEYAYRNGTTTVTPFGRELELEILRNYSWFGQPRIQPFKGKMPTAWGLFDMPANTWEWCQDSFRDAESGIRIMRGGDNNSAAYNLSAASQSRCTITAASALLPVGFRVVISQVDLSAPK